MFYRFLDTNNDFVLVNINSISVIYPSEHYQLYRILFNSEYINVNSEIYIDYAEFKKFESWLYHHETKIKKMAFRM